MCIVFNKARTVTIKYDSNFKFEILDDQGDILLWRATLKKFLERIVFSHKDIKRIKFCLYDKNGKYLFEIVIHSNQFFNGIRCCFDTAEVLKIDFLDTNYESICKYMILRRNIYGYNFYRTGR
ncbi:MAG: hypothetical protein Q4D02_03450 [Clostridia bacterium]|nr:hypothetical protein [Clostridia bacterium]